MWKTIVVLTALAFVLGACGGSKKDSGTTANASAEVDIPPMVQLKGLQTELQGSLDALMQPAYFRSHRRYLVNLAHIREILPGDAGTFEIVMRDAAKSRVPLSRRQARKLKELIPW